MRVTRRDVLKRSVIVGVGVVGGTKTVAGGSADPRAEPVAGTSPNTNVPTTTVGALPGQDGPVSTGNWIHHANGWFTSPEEGHECGLYELLDETTQVYTIDGEEFVLDSVEDWKFQDPDPEPGSICNAEFSFTTPPKPPGTTYEVRWDVYGDEERHPVIGAFPFVNEIEVVRKRGNGK